MTDVPLRDYMEKRLDALERVLVARLDAADTAIRVHEDMLKDRLFHSNGLIEQMRQQSTDYTRKGAMEAAEERISNLERSRSGGEGKVLGGQPLQTIGMMIVAAIVSAVVAYIAAGRVTP
jgi:hypothetical protein